MASSAVSRTAERESAANLPVVHTRVRPIPEGHLPLSELTYDRAGAGSPFGDDLRLPLPVSELTYVHPTPGAPPQHL